MRCPVCGEENPERARFCLNCATPLTAAEPAGESRKVVTIVFADMAGSTAIGERMDPEALRRLQARYFDSMTAVLQRHGGTVEKYIGDAVMAVFGIPQLHEDDPLRAVRAAIEMQQAVGALNVDLERDYGVRIAIRIGVHTGEVVSSDQHADQRLVTGDTVNVAARLEQAAAAGEILLGGSTYRLVRDAVEVQEVEPLELKGKSERVAAYRLVRVAPDTAGHVRHLDSPLVGRTKELELFRRALERTHDERTSHLFTLLGPAGVGKSRVVREFLSTADGATVLRGRCLSYGEGITYYAVGEIVRQAAAVSETDDEDASLAKLTALLSDAEEGERVARLVGGLVGWAEPCTPDDGAWGFRRLLEHLAHDRTLVVVLDDVHWAEPLLLDLFEYLADWTRDAELLLVCIARPELLELRPGWGGGKMNATSILLEPLAGDEADALLGNLLGGADIPPLARDRILAAAEGNPLFVEEMIGMLIDDGLLRYEDGAWRAIDDLAALTVPPTIQLLLAARLDRLDAEERAVIERGAVEGKVFHTGAIMSLVPEGQRTSVRPRLLALARKELIRPDRAEFAGDDAFRFRHLLIRDAAYQAMPKEQRADLHEAFARWLTGVAADRLDDYREILGHHFEQAYRYRTAIGPPDDRTDALAEAAADALLRSAERALNRSDVNGSIHMLERTVEIATGERRAEALVELGEQLEHTGAYRRCIEVLDALLASPDAEANPALAVRARVFRLMAHGMMDPEVGVQEGDRRARVLLADAEATGDEMAIRAGVLACASMAFFRGRCGEAREIAARLLPDAGRMNPMYRSLVVATLGLDVYFGTVPVSEGSGIIDRMRAIHGDGVSGNLRCDALEGSLAAMAGDRETFLRTWERVDRGWEELGDPTGGLQMGQSLAECAWRLGDDERALATLRWMKADLDARGETGSNSTVTAILATYLAEAGEIEDARVLAAASRAITAPDDFGATVPLAWVEGLIASVDGDHAGAVETIDEALATARATDYLNFTADTVRIRGQVLLAAGRRDEADAAFAEATAMWEHKENVASIRRMQAWREEHA